MQLLWDIHCIVVIGFLIIIGLSGANFYFYWHLKESNTDVTNFNANTETVIY